MKQAYEWSRSHGFDIESVVEIQADARRNVPLVKAFDKLVGSIHYLNDAKDVVILGAEFRELEEAWAASKI